MTQCANPPPRPLQRYLVGKNSKLLKTVCDEVEFGTQFPGLVSDLFRIMKENGGVGLAAPQIGETVRVIVIKYASTFALMINPVIIKTPGKIVTSMNEGCLSFPGLRVDRKRHKRVIVEYFDENWKKVKLDARGLLAFIVQHEIDHLNGITINSEDSNA
ncbi:MAG: peptide deformylase [Phycisphaeraceae bacterium]|nr:peptide deformylase [Phycisphaeraceae bacterium]